MLILIRHLGLERTGLLGMFMLVSTSTLCVASIFVPGSPFLNNIYGSEEMKQENLGDNMSEPAMGEAEEQEHSGNNMSELTMEEAEALITQYDFAHITILIAGIIIARFGKKLLHNDNVYMYNFIHCQTYSISKSGTALFIF